MIVIVCGLSGSGKSHLLDELDVEALGFTKIKASDILKSGNMPTTHLDLNSAITNQKYLLSVIAKSDIRNANFLLDGHLLIETNEGPALVPDSFVLGLPVAAILSIVADPVDILRRRPRKNSCPNELRELIQIEAANARRLAVKKKIFYRAIADGSVKDLTSALSEIVTQNGAESH
jgi:adenylate kinase